MKYAATPGQGINAVSFFDTDPDALLALIAIDRALRWLPGVSLEVVEAEVEECPGPDRPLYRIRYSVVPREPLSQIQAST